MANIKRTCFCCGKEYKYCPHCPGDQVKPSYFFMFDSENCQTIFESLQKYAVEEITAEECLGQLKECDLTDMKDFIPSVRESLQAVLALKPSTSSKKKNKVSE